MIPYPSNLSKAAPTPTYPAHVTIGDGDAQIAEVDSTVTYEMGQFTPIGAGISPYGAGVTFVGPTFRPDLPPRASAYL